MTRGHHIQAPVSAGGAILACRVLYGATTVIFTEGPTLRVIDVPFRQGEKEVERSSWPPQKGNIGVRSSFLTIISSQVKNEDLTPHDFKVN